ncbi:acyl carrier protein [Raoultibacter phocaeensis]|uniref:acyl carrier protein n=1 Tax=Raoultibacter phocaeensis TaxID=2479841 RepID=UPI001119530D|nr:acyl carrier protein [Raoultibacter phocaeensis]
MSNSETYDQIFLETLELEEEQLGDGLEYQSVSNWDSVGHMQLTSALEDAFDIMLDTDDIIDFTSYSVGKDILRKYGVEF